MFISFLENSQKIYRRFYTEWLPYSGYTYGETADIEIYPDSNEKDIPNMVFYKIKKILYFKKKYDILIK